MERPSLAEIGSGHSIKNFEFQIQLMNLKSASLAAAVLVAAAASAPAANFVSQNPVSGGGVSRWSQLWQDPSPAGNDLDSDAVCWADFTLSSASTIDHMEWWVPIACYSAIGLGTLTGGWKIVKTMGTRITKVTPFEGVAAETAGAITLFVTEALKIPVSTTHTITGSIMGVGATKRLSAVRWGVTINLLWAWILTIPISALLAAGIFYLVRMFQ
jgi:phosphate/sulfate permease